jgi:hypothetical protein
METEEKIVYSIIETVQKGNLTDDSKIDERVIRAFLQKYRAAAIGKYSMSGQIISDECFQFLGSLPFVKLSNRKFERKLPKFIQLNNRSGFYFEISGESIPVLNSEEFHLSMKSIMNGNLPKAKMSGNNALIYTGEYKVVDGKKRPKSNVIIDELEDQIYENENEFINIDVYGVLDNPDEAEDYDWTKDPYPCPSDLVEEITTKILAKEYNVILNVRQDKVTDSNDESSAKPTQNQQN